MSKIDSFNFEDLRYEKKFVISELELQELEHLIKSNSVMFSEIFHERTVNNIYLDSYDFRNYNENLDGVSQRLKIRIRWYGEIFTIIQDPVLELKMKCNELGKKWSFPLKSFSFDKNFSLELLQQIFSKSNLPAGLAEKLKSYHPTLLNSYTRKYFVSASKKHRITLDRNQVFLRIREQNNLFNEKIVNKDEYILELKYSSKDYRETESILQELPLRVIAHSKYVEGIKLLNL